MYPYVEYKGKSKPDHEWVEEVCRSFISRYSSEKVPMINGGIVLFELWLN